MNLGLFSLNLNEFEQELVFFIHFVQNLLISYAMFCKFVFSCRILCFIAGIHCICTSICTKIPLSCPNVANIARNSSVVLGIQGN